MARSSHEYANLVALLPYPPSFSLNLLSKHRERVTRCCLRLRVLCCGDPPSEEGVENKRPRRHGICGRLACCCCGRGKGGEDGVGGGGCGCCLLSALPQSLSRCCGGCRETCAKQKNNKIVVRIQGVVFTVRDAFYKHMLKRTPPPRKEYNGKSRRCRTVHSRR